MENVGKIPKVIHYCWFGRGEIPSLGRKCIDSWKKFFPGYEIIEWNETNFNLDICDYVKEAYEKEKWAFVSDYARFWILYNYGGVYFDTDVEVISSMDKIIEEGPFMGFEPVTLQAKNSGAPCISVAPGLGMGAYPKMEFYKKILDHYNNEHFVLEDGSTNYMTVVDYVTKKLLEDGLEKVESKQIINNITIYPTEFFCPMNYETGEIQCTSRTVSIHYYMASWKNTREKRVLHIQQKLINIFGKTIGYKLGRLYSMPYRVTRKLIEKGLIETFKVVMNNVQRRKKNG